jgi:phospholipid transport system substrate-binding protein
VNTVVHRRNGDQVRVDYSLQRTRYGWKVYDVTIAGVSYLLSFRDDFREEIRILHLRRLFTDDLHAASEAAATPPQRMPGRRSLRRHRLTPVARLHSFVAMP